MVTNVSMLTYHASRFIFSSFFLYFFLFVSSGGLSWVHVSFLLHVNYTVSYHIVSYRLNGSLHWSCRTRVVCTIFNPLKFKGNYIATSNKMKLVHWPLMGALVQRGGDWAGPQPPQTPPRCTKAPINGQCTNSVYQSPYCRIMLSCFTVSTWSLKLLQKLQSFYLSRSKCNKNKNLDKRLYCTYLFLFFH